MKDYHITRNITHPKKDTLHQEDFYLILALGARNGLGYHAVMWHRKHSHLLASCIALTQTKYLCKSLLDKTNSVSPFLLVNNVSIHSVNTGELPENYARNRCETDIWVTTARQV